MRLFKTGHRLHYAVNGLRQLWSRARSPHIDARAMALVYTSLMALIPFLAVTFSLLKAFGAHRQLEPLLHEMLTPMGAGAAPAALLILDSVHKLKVGVLGFVGFLFLLYASYSLLVQVEEAFNFIWRSHRPRSLWRRLSDYFSIILLVPMLGFSGFSSLAGLVGRQSAAASGWHEWLWNAIEITIPYLAVIIAFTLVFRIIPSAHVRWKPALLAGIVAGFTWKVGGWLFAHFIASSAQYHAVYSSFAILIVFMIWLYVTWMILLLGLQVAYFLQYPLTLNRSALPERLPSICNQELAGLTLMSVVGACYLEGQCAPGATVLAEKTGVSEFMIDRLLTLLVREKLLLQLSEEDHSPVFVPARDLAAIRLSEILRAVRDETEAVIPLPHGIWQYWQHAAQHMMTADPDACLRDVLLKSSD